MSWIDASHESNLNGDFGRVAGKSLDGRSPPDTIDNSYNGYNSNQYNNNQSVNSSSSRFQSKNTMSNNTSSSNARPSPTRKPTKSLVCSI